MKPKNLIPRMKLLSLLLALAVLLSLQPAVLAEGSAAAPEEAPDSEKTMSIAEIVAMVTAAAHEVAEKARHFTIPEDALVAPKPIEECYGTCSMDHPEVVMDLIQRARDSGLLGQDETVAFSPDANFYHGYHGRNFEYYLDDTIMVILWKENVEGKCCSFAEVKIADASQFRRKLANDSFGPGPQFLASELGEQVNAVVTMNADYYRPRHYGIVVYNRELCRFETDYVINNCLRYNCVDSMFVTASGDFLYKRQGEEDTLESISAFIQENDILFSLDREAQHVQHAVRAVREGIDPPGRLRHGQEPQRVKPVERVLHRERRERRAYKVRRLAVIVLRRHTLVGQIAAPVAGAQQLPPGARLPLKEQHAVFRIFRRRDRRHHPRGARPDDRNG